MNAAAAKTARPNGSYLRRAISSSTGMKWVMALTGLALLLFVVAHVLGNLQIFLGYEQINAYGAFLKSSPGLLWTARIGLLLAAGLHIWAGVRLSRINHAARPQPYVRKRWREASWFSRYMLVSGAFVLAFVIFHLLHFTIGTIFPEDFALRDPQQRHDVYRMMLLGFSRPWVVVLYVAAMAMLFFHLAHGVWSATQSMGFWGTRFTPFMLKASVVVAVVLAIAYAIIPIGVLAGAVPDYAQEKAAAEAQQKRAQP